jgi:hypothetical protein
MSSATGRKGSAAPEIGKHDAIEPRQAVGFREDERRHRNQIACMRADVGEEGVAIAALRGEGSERGERRQREPADRDAEDRATGDVSVAGRSPSHRAQTTL